MNPYLTKSDDVMRTLEDMHVYLKERGRDKGLYPHFFQQVKDLEQYVLTLNSKPARIMNKDFPYAHTMVGKDLQYDIDYFIRAANNFDVLYKKTWNAMDIMKNKVLHTHTPIARLDYQDTTRGPVYVL